jgi:cytochrome c oxidase subunit IV
MLASWLTRYRTALGFLALAALLLALLVHAGSVLGADVEAAWPRVWLLHGGVFPAILLAALTLAALSGRHRASLRELLALVPVPARLLVASALVYVLLSLAFLTPLTGAGDPFSKDSRFFFNDHGVVREVSESAYHRQRGLTLRIYSSIWAYLYLFSAVVLLCARPRRTGASDYACAKGRK